MSSLYHITDYTRNLLGEDALQSYEKALEALDAHIAENFSQSDMPYPLYDPSLTQNTAHLHDWVKQARTHATQLNVLGTGGSSLGGQALVAFMQGESHVNFIDNIDPETLQHYVNETTRDDVHWLIVSKSGGTLETITQASVILAALGKEKASGAATIITSDAQNPLHDLAKAYDVPLLTHPDLGGRFSLFSSVALLPAIWAGLDEQALLRGATESYNTLKTQKSAHPASQGAALQASLMARYPINILMPYCDRLETLANWHKQLWAESLGKQGHGSTPVRALGTVDQHSQLQLYLQGPADKFFTLICVDNRGTGPRVDVPLTGEPWDLINGRHAGGVMQASQMGTIASLRAHEKPLRVIEIGALNARAVGALAMHFMLETILTAKLLGVNAYDQPAVEDGKQRTRDFLRNPSAEVV